MGKKVTRENVRWADAKDDNSAGSWVDNPFDLYRILVSELHYDVTECRQSGSGESNP